MEMQFDYSELREKIRVMYRTQAIFSDACGFCRTSLNQKLMNRKPFYSYEIFIMADKLGIKNKEYGSYFFTPKVEKAQPEENNAKGSNQCKTIPAEGL